jgi:hypothetical protein
MLRNRSFPTHDHENGLLFLGPPLFGRVVTVARFCRGTNRVIRELVVKKLCPPDHRHRQQPTSRRSSLTTVETCFRLLKAVLVLPTVLRQCYHRLETLMHTIRVITLKATE